MMVEAIKTALKDLDALVTIVAKDTGALVMSDPDEESVGSTLEGDLEMTFGHVRRAHAAVSALESLQRENEDLKRRLFPYADTTEIGGISWDGKYLIGDKASIRSFQEMQNRGLQIDVYKQAYDENVAAFKARAEAAEAEVKRLRNKVAARALTDKQLADEIEAIDEACKGGFGEGGGSPGEWWYERADELEHERKRRELESQLKQHNSRTALSSTGDTHGN